AIRPQALWIIVLLFCALNFAGFLARRSAGERRGYLLTGLLGGVISSTAVTLGFARYSRQFPESSSALAWGVIGACTVLVPRVILISFVLNAEVAIQLLPLLIPAGVIGAVVVGFAWRSNQEVPVVSGNQPMSWLSGDKENPLRIWVAIRLAIIFQLAMMAITFARQTWAVKGLYSTAVVLGLTDVDALTVSMSTPSSQLIATVAAKAIAAGILANTVVKLAISVVVGSPRYRLVAGAILVAMGAVIGAALVLL
ncbi:MAG: DUF4010 domain-containing protein, partial [Thermoanaerobaculia bacterium]